MTESPPVTLRLATESDRRALRRLAELDSAEPLAGTVLLAEVDGELHAACSVQGRRAIANPFQPTAELVALLRVRADQLADRAGERRLGRVLRLRRRRRRAATLSPRRGRAVAYAADGPPRRSAGV